MSAVVLTPPQSKSDAERALVLAHALEWPALAQGVDLTPAAPRDVRVLAEGLRALERGSPRELDCADGGAPFRFLLALAALTEGRWALTGSVRLGERPHQPLIDALRGTLGAAGLSIQPGSPWPVVVTGVRDAALAAPRFRVDATQSSQFASSLLLACAALHHRDRRSWALELEGAPASSGYLELTRQWLLRAGYQVEGSAGALAVTG